MLHIFLSSRFISVHHFHLPDTAYLTVILWRETVPGSSHSCLRVIERELRSEKGKDENLRTLDITLCKSVLFFTIMFTDMSHVFNVQWAIFSSQIVGLLEIKKRSFPQYIVCSCVFIPPLHFVQSRKQKWSPTL